MKNKLNRKNFTEYHNLNCKQKNYSDSKNKYLESKLSIYTEFKYVILTTHSELL